MIHPLLAAMVSVFAAHLASRIILHPKEPLFLRWDRSLALRIAFEGFLLTIVFTFTGTLLSTIRRTISCALVYLLLSVVNEFLWKRFAKGKSRFIGTYLFQTLLMLATAVKLSRAQISSLWHLPLNQEDRLRLLIVVLVYLTTIFLGGRLIRRAIRALGLPSISEETPAQLQDAGLYIGWLERFLVLTAICMQAPMIVGLILTAKSVARFPEFQKAKFAEYFLVGTLLSLTLAVSAGLILIEVMYGTIRLK